MKGKLQYSKYPPISTPPFDHRQQIQRQHQVTPYDLGCDLSYKNCDIYSNVTNKNKSNSHANIYVQSFSQLSEEMKKKKNGSSTNVNQNAINSRRKKAYVHGTQQPTKFPNQMQVCIDGLNKQNKQSKDIKNSVQVKKNQFQQTFQLSRFCWLVIIRLTLQKGRAQNFIMKEQKQSSLKHPPKDLIRKKDLLKAMRKYLHCYLQKQQLRKDFFIQEEFLAFQKVEQMLRSNPKTKMTMDDIYCSLFVDGQFDSKRQSQQKFSMKDKKSKLTIQIQDQNIETARFQENKHGKKSSTEDPLKLNAQKIIKKIQCKPQEQNSMGIIMNSALLQPIQMTESFSEGFDKLNGSSWRKSNSILQSEVKNYQLKSSQPQPTHQQQQFLSQSLLETFKQKILKFQNQNTNRIYESFVAQALDQQIYQDSNHKFFNAIRINFNKAQSASERAQSKSEKLKQLEKGMFDHQNEIRRYIKYISAIKILNLQQSNLISLMLHPNLKILNLSCNNLASFNFGKFKPQEDNTSNNETYFPKLQFLSLSHNKITNIHYALTLPQLRELHMQDNKIDHISGQLLSFKLKILDLGYNQIDDQCNLYALRGFTELQMVNIIGNPLVEKRKLQNRRKSSRRLSIESSYDPSLHASDHTSIHSSIAKGHNNSQIGIFPKDLLQQYQSVKIFSQYNQYQEITFNEDEQIPASFRRKMSQLQKQRKNCVKKTKSHDKKQSTQDRIKKYSGQLQNSKYSVYRQARQPLLQLPVVESIPITSTLPHSTTNSQNQKTQQICKKTYQQHQQLHRFNRMKTQYQYKNQRQNVCKNKQQQDFRQKLIKERRSQQKSQKSLSNKSNRSSYFRQVVVLKDQIQLMNPKTCQYNILQIQKKQNKRNRSLESLQNISSSSVLNQLENRANNDKSSQRYLTKVNNNVNYGKQNKRKTKNGNNLSILSCQSSKNNENTNINHQKPFQRMKVHKNFSISRRGELRKQDSLAEAVRKVRRSSSNLDFCDKNKNIQKLFKMVDTQNSKQPGNTKAGNYQYVYEKHYNQSSNVNEKRSSKSKINSSKKKL